MYFYTLTCEYAIKNEAWSSSHQIVYPGSQYKEHNEEKDSVACTFLLKIDSVRIKLLYLCGHEFHFQQIS